MKATPDSVMALALELVGVSGEEDIRVYEKAHDALRAEVERLASQSAPTGYPKETIDLLVHAITRSDDAADAIADLEAARTMLGGKTIRDVLDELHDGAQSAPLAQQAASYEDAADALAIACTGGDVIGPAQMQRAINHFLATRAAAQVEPQANTKGARQ
jgi:hypothetical protein